MKIGFIGAGKVGFTFGKHFCENGYEVTGYYSRNPKSAREAATFTDTGFFETLDAVVSASDALFLTVPDRAVGSVWDQLKKLDMTDKIVCHTSGALSSDIFSGIAEKGAFGYSIHPLFAVHSRLDSYKEISQAFITMEGHEKYLDDFRQMFEKMGHGVAVIDKSSKTKYHAAAVFSSNLIVGIVAHAQEMLTDCGFSKEAAAAALKPIFRNNCENIVNDGTTAALTGPVERNDISTLEKHLSVLDPHEREIYLSLSEEALKVAKVKNPERDYGTLETFLKTGMKKNASYSGTMAQRAGR